MKALFKVLIAIVVVLVVGLIGVYLARNVIAASVIRTAASSVLGVKVDVESVDVNLGGSAQLNGFAVGNPPNYKQPHVLTAGMIRVVLNPSESTTSKLVVEEVLLDDVDVFFIAKDGKNNVSQITDGLQSSGGESSKGGESMEIVIKKIVLTKLQAHASLDDSPGDALAMIERIELTNISTKGGVDDASRQLSGKIFEITMQATFNAVGKQLPGAISEGVGKSLDAAGVVIGQTAKAVGEAANKAVEGAGKALEGAGKGLGDLFGGNKDK